MTSWQKCQGNVIAFASLSTVLRDSPRFHGIIGFRKASGCVHAVPYAQTFTRLLVPSRWTGVGGKDFAVNVDVRVDRELDHATIVLSGPFDLAHASEVVRAVQSAEADLDGCHSAEVSLTRVNRIDGTGAVLLARLLERLATNGCRTEVTASDNPEVARLLSLYHRHKTDQPSLPPRSINPFARLGVIAAEIPAEGSASSTRTRFHTESSLHSLDALDDNNGPGATSPRYSWVIQSAS